MVHFIDENKRCPLCKGAQMIPDQEKIDKDPLIKYLMDCPRCQGKGEVEK